MSTVTSSVLIAEDNRVLSDVLSFNLVRAGFEAIVALDGQQAIAQLQSRAFDAVLTDFQMPGATGEELCRFIRQDLQLAQLPILMCSAKGLELDVEQLKSQWGITAVIYKPFSVRDIIARLREAVPPVEICT